MYFFIMLLFFLLYKYNIFYFCPFLNVWVTAVSQNTCFVFCKSLHHKQIPFLAVLMSLFPLVVLSSHIPASWSAFFRLISFIPYHTRLYWCFFPSIPFFFFLSAFTFGPLISSVSPIRTVIRCVWCRMSVALVLSENWTQTLTFLSNERCQCAMDPSRGGNPCSSLRRNLRTSPGGRHIPHTFVFPLCPFSSQTGCT